MPNAYPLSAYSYLVTQCSPPLASAQKTQLRLGPNGTTTFPTQKGQALGQFVTYLACAGQEKMALSATRPCRPTWSRRTSTPSAGSPADRAAAGRDGGQLQEPLRRRFHTILPGEPVIQGVVKPIAGLHPTSSSDLAGAGGGATGAAGSGASGAAGSTTGVPVGAGSGSGSGSGSAVRNGVPSPGPIPDRGADRPGLPDRQRPGGRSSRRARGRRGSPVPRRWSTPPRASTATARRLGRLAGGRAGRLRRDSSVWCTCGVDGHWQESQPAEAAPAEVGQ